MTPRLLLSATLLAGLLPAARGDELPPEVQRLLTGYERESAALREKLLSDLYNLERRYTREGKTAEARAVRDQIRRLGGAVTVTPATARALPDPGNLTGYRAQVGKSLLFDVTGATGGSVWGSDVYTDDSVLAAAAVHAGVLQPGQRGVVKVTILGGQDGYTGSTRNGVTTGNWGAWEGSYRVAAAPGIRLDRPPADNAAALPDPGTLVGYRGQNGKVLYFRVTGRADAGTVWGSDVYTDDSALAAAAVHAGVLRDGQSGVVKVTIVEGKDGYEGSTRNGVTTENYGSWQGSFRVGAARREEK